MFEQDFETMLRQYETALDDKKRFTALVKDLFPDQDRNVNLLLIAYNMGIAQEMQKAAIINQAFAFRYVKRLMDEFGMSRVNADWIVSVWCSCYGGKVLGKSCEIALQKPGAKPAIVEEQMPGAVYGNLFEYRKSQQGEGLAVTGFRGQKRQTVIFQNQSGNIPVIEIADNSFSNDQIEEAIFTEGFLYIGEKAFAGCRNLHQVILSDSMREIGTSAFEGCKSLKSVSFPDRLERIGAFALRNTGLKTLEIPRSVYWLGEGVVFQCPGLVQVTIPENIDRIPEQMFEKCTALKKVELHEKLKEIGERAFFGCDSLDLLVIPDSVMYIGKDAFTGTDQQFLIQCSFGSYAESYARKNKIKYQLV